MSEESKESVGAIGFSLGVSSDESPEEVFLENIRFAEWLHRERNRGRRIPLRDRLKSLFDTVSEEARSLITNDQEELIREMVRTRNSLVHLLEGPDGKRAEGERLESLSVKLGILLLFHWGYLDYGEDPAKSAVPGIRKNSHLMKHLAKSDRVDDSQLRLTGF